LTTAASKQSSTRHANRWTGRPAGFTECFSASYATTMQEDLSISERQNYLDKVKQRNEKILEITGKSFTATANPQIQD
jgi:hypothetical protein